MVQSVCGPRTSFLISFVNSNTHLAALLIPIASALHLAWHLHWSLALWLASGLGAWWRPCCYRLGCGIFWCRCCVWLFFALALLCKVGSWREQTLVESIVHECGSFLHKNLLYGRVAIWKWNLPGRWRRRSRCRALETFRSRVRRTWCWMWSIGWPRAGATFHWCPISRTQITSWRFSVWLHWTLQRWGDLV